MDIALPEAIHEEALLAADVGERDIKLADDAVQSALAVGERAFKLPEVLRKELLERLDLEARVPSYEGAIASYSPGPMTPGSNAGLKARCSLDRPVSVAVCRWPLVVNHVPTVLDALTTSHPSETFSNLPLGWPKSSTTWDKPRIMISQTRCCRT